MESLPTLASGQAETGHVYLVALFPYFYKTHDGFACLFAVIVMEFVIK